MTLYEVTFVILRDQENGMQKKVSEKYLVRCEDAELIGAVTKGLEQVIEESEDVEATSAKKTKIVDIFGEANKENIYDAKVSIITIDEKTAKEKRTSIEQVVWADTLDEARTIVEAEYKKSMLDYKITDIHETCYLDIF